MAFKFVIRCGNYQGNLMILILEEGTHYRYEDKQFLFLKWQTKIVDWDRISAEINDIAERLGMFSEVLVEKPKDLFILIRFKLKGGPVLGEDIIWLTEVCGKYTKGVILPEKINKTKLDYYPNN